MSALDPSLVTIEGTGLILSAARGIEETQAVKLLGVRPRDPEWAAAVTLRDGDAAIVVRIDDQHWAGGERRGDQLKERLVVGRLDQDLAVQGGVFPESLATRAMGPVGERQFRSGPDSLELGYLRKGEFRRLGISRSRTFSQCQE